MIKKVDFKELSNADAVLVEKARQATSLSYSPYSHFAVGAAVLLSNGAIVCGANQENASYPVGICAERSTLATAQNLYPGVAVVALALAAKNEKGDFTDDVVTPCGMCRQAIAECKKRYGNDMRIIMTSSSEIFVSDNILDLLPMVFS